MFAPNGTGAIQDTRVARFLMPDRRLARVVARDEIINLFEIKKDWFSIDNSFGRRVEGCGIGCRAGKVFHSGIRTLGP
jgi:hypothetical protein